jgi:hypothetical protein
MRAVATYGGKRKQLTIPFPYEVNNQDREAAERMAEALGYECDDVQWVATGHYMISDQEILDRRATEADHYAWSRMDG